jgi:surface protein
MKLGIRVTWGKATIVDRAPANEAFEFTVQTDDVGTSADNQFTIPITSATLYNIETSDGQSITGATGATTITFPSPGLYTIKITESCIGWRFGGAGDKNKMRNVNNWGIYANTSDAAFFLASNMTCTATDKPLGVHTRMDRAFHGCTNFNGAIGNWDVSTVTRFDQFVNATIFNQDVSSWDITAAPSLIYMFFGASQFNQDISSWDTSNANNMQQMFNGASAFNQDISGWDVSNVTNMQGMFKSASSFNQDISGWDVSNVTNMRDMFQFASAFNQTLSTWNTISVTDMYNMFNGCSSLNSLDVSSWNTSSVTTMTSMFYGCSSLTALDPSSWDTSNVTAMNSMFRDCSLLSTLNISSWNTSSVTTFDRMFGAASLFNTNISNWDVSNVTRFSFMFERAFAFNQPIGSWTTTSATFMSSMFDGVGFVMAFNQDISSWDVSGVTEMANMFRNCRSFDQPLSSWNTASLQSAQQLFFECDAFDFANVINWDIVDVTNFTNFMYQVPDLSTATYDAILVSWEAQLQVAYPGGVGYTPTISIIFNGSTYTLGSAAETARTSLINTYGWTITDGGGIAAPFIFTVENTFNTNPLAFTIPADTATYTYSYDVSTSDGQSFTNQTGPLALTFAGVGPYDITVSGTYPSMRFGTSPSDANKVVDVKQFGSNTWQDFRDMFGYTLLSVVTATDTPNLSAVTSLKNCFKNATSYNDPKLDNWDVSTITSYETFLWCPGPVIYGSFNQDLSSWDTSQANTFYFMFNGCPMNQSFAAWDVTSLGTTNPTTAGNSFISPQGQTPLMSTANYDATLISWAAQAVQTGVSISFLGAKYTLGGAAESARNTLINTYGWTIADAGGV